LLSFGYDLGKTKEHVSTCKKADAGSSQKPPTPRESDGTGPSFTNTKISDLKGKGPTVSKKQSGARSKRRGVTKSRLKDL